MAVVVPAVLDQECPTRVEKLDMMVAMVVDQATMAANMRREVLVAVAVRAQAGMVVMGDMELMDLLEVPEVMVMLMLEIWVMLIPEALETLEILEILDLQEILEIPELMGMREI